MQMQSTASPFRCMRSSLRDSQLSGTASRLPTQPPHLFSSHCTRMVHFPARSFAEQAPVNLSELNLTAPRKEQSAC